MVHQPVSRGLAAFADAWLSGWLAEISADLRETVAHQRWCSTTMRYTNPRLLYFIYSRRFTYISGHPSAVGRAQDTESSPVKDQRSTTMSLKYGASLGYGLVTWVVRVICAGRMTVQTC